MTKQTMTTKFLGSAKIYTFPPRGGFAPTREAETAMPAAPAQLPAGAAFAASGSSWYHDEAIRDALVKTGQGRKN